MKIVRGEFTLSSLPSDQQVDRIHAYLTRSYWAEGIPLALVQRCVENSLCFSLLHRDLQVGFARVVTDRSTFAYLCDVYILEEFRGQGLALWMMENVRRHPDLQGLRRFMLATRDAHRLYLKLGFKPPVRPEALMEIVVPNPYLNGGSASPGSAAGSR